MRRDRTDLGVLAVGILLAVVYTVLLVVICTQMYDAAQDGDTASAIVWTGWLFVLAASWRAGSER